jgi:hypothetical protein
MNLYLVSRKFNDTDYDEAEAFVCVAGSEQEARNINPMHDNATFGGERWWDEKGEYISWPRWTTDIDSLTVKYIGHAAAGISGVILVDVLEG